MFKLSGRLLLVGALLFSTTAQSQNAPVKKSRNNICHAPHTRYYAQTKHFAPYKTLDACLKSGGRLPKR